jgi:FkbH-like protein
MTEASTAQAVPSTRSDGLLRESVQSFIAAGNRDAALQAARMLLSGQPGLRTERFLRKAAESDAGRRLGLKPCKVALLSSFSIEFVHDPLIAYGFANGFQLVLYQAGFGAFRQELLDQSSGLYASSPDVVLLAVEGEDWVPAAYGSYASSGEQDHARVIEDFTNEARALLEGLRKRSNAPVLVHNFAPPAWRHYGILDAKSASGQGRLVQQLNEALQAAAGAFADVHVVDYAALVNRQGARQWYDARMRLYAKCPLTHPALTCLAREYLKYLRSFAGFNRKCLVLDLDNTLWGGVVGEEGIDGIALGTTYPGSAFVEFQNRVLDLRRRGVILAVASKNNPADVDEIFARHQSMVLRKEHFADMQVHWEPKSVSLTRIAKNLAIGLEHIVFADDNPAECEQVRGALPGVTVIQLPPQPERYIEALEEDGWFDTVSLSDEDRRRGELYQQRDQAEAMRAANTSIEDYYRALDMEMRVAPVDGSTLKRAAQLTQKTNQLNVTTIRYTEAELTQRMADPDWHLVTVGVTDKFGDNGIVGIMFAHAGQDSLDIDTFLLSCRVIGRTVETAMLAHLCDLAEQRNLRSLNGRLIPTSKNVPVRDLFERHGFEKISEDPAGATNWRIGIPDARVKWPEWFRVVRAGTGG